MLREEPHTCSDSLCAGLGRTGQAPRPGLDLPRADIFTRYVTQNEWGNPRCLLPSGLSRPVHQRDRAVWGWLVWSYWAPGARAPKAASQLDWLQTAPQGCFLQTCHLGTGPLWGLLPSKCEPRVGGHIWAEGPLRSACYAVAVACCYCHCTFGGEQTLGGAQGLWACLLQAPAAVVPQIEQK